MSTISDCQRKFDERVVKTKLFVTVLCLSTILRLLLLASTDVLLNTGDDGSSYASLARMIMAADLSRDDGSRSPGYPLLLALLGNQPEAIRLTQILLGLCTTGALFVLSWQITSSTVASFVVSAYYGLSVTQARYEASLLSETLTTFTLTVCFLALSKVAVRVQFRSATALVLLGLGLLAGLPALARPAYAFLPLIVACWLFPSVRPKARVAWFIAPALIPILMWSAFNFARFGMFTPSTVLGFNLANHSGAYIEYASDRYSIIKQAFQDALESEAGATRINVLHDPVDCTSVRRGEACTVQSKIRAVTGQTVPELSRTLTQMSLELFTAHPGWYLHSVFGAWTQFWTSPGWPEGLAHSDSIDWWLRRISSAEKLIIGGTSAIFLVTVCTQILRAILRGRTLAHPVVVLMAVSVLAASILSAMFDPAEMPRYGTPVEPFAACVVIATILRGRRAWLRDPQRTAAGLTAESLPPTRTWSM